MTLDTGFLKAEIARCLRDYAARQSEPVRELEREVEQLKWANNRLQRGNTVES
jgi:hypothetical protein